MTSWQQGLLQQAKRNKKDEFYTTLPVIEAELENYTSAFVDKTVYLNCDDPRKSNFYQYFVDHFEQLKLKRIIATSYVPFNIENDFYNRRSRQVVYSKGSSGRGVLESTKELRGDGDFRSEESVELLKQADIVVTNPPFSLFREYVAQLVEYNKKFIILGNMTAATSKEIFPLFAENKVWYGKSIHSGDREFIVPDDYPLSPKGQRIDENGTRYIRVKGVRWFTNLDYPDRYQELKLTRHYDPELYPRYANFDAIEVGKTADIPMDYAGAMGVPVSFLDKYNPEQFEILGSSRTMSEPMGKYAKAGSYSPGGPRFYLDNGDGTFRRLFERIVIKNRSVEK